MTICPQGKEPNRAKDGPTSWTVGPLGPRAGSSLWTDLFHKKNP